MKGYIRQRGAAWELRVFLGYDPVTRKQLYAYRTVHGGKRDAQRMLAEMITEVDKGLVARTNATVKDLLEAWFELAAADFSPTTVKETRGYMDRSLLPTLGHRQLAKLNPAEIDAFYQRLRASGGVRGQPLAPATIRRIHGVLRRALGQGVKWGWLAVNPAASASPPKVPQPDITPPSPEQLLRLLERARRESPELACYLLLAAATGARRSEMVALRWSDIDLDDAVVRISRGIVIGNHGLVEKDTKTHSSRRVSLDAGTAAVMAEHRQKMLARAEVCGAELLGDGFVFSNEPDGAVCWFPASVSRWFKQLCDREEISNVRLHDLRHFVATQLLSAGVDVRTVAGRLGHRNAATTLNVYAHFLEQTDRVAADIIGSVIAGPSFRK
jgi:integrase